MAVKTVDLNNPEELSQVILKIEDYVKTVVSESRYEHSVRTARTAEKMCALYGLEPKIGYLAGIAHDMCKEFSTKNLFRCLNRTDLDFCMEGRRRF